MTRSSLKTLLAISSLALAGAAVAQGTPPNPNVSNPAQGAGQQTQQGTSMGTTGVPAANQGTTAMPNTAAAGASMSTDNGAAPRSRPMRAARVDRN